jgi:hypothetical protein
LTVVISVSGHSSIGPTAVEAQSKVRVSSAISPEPKIRGGAAETNPRLGAVEFSGEAIAFFDSMGESALFDEGSREIVKNRILIHPYTL